MNFETYLESVKHMSGGENQITIHDFRHFKDLKGTIDYKSTKKGSDAKKGIQGFWVLWFDDNEGDYNINHVEIIKNKGTLLLHKVSPVPEASGTKAEMKMEFARFK